MSKVDSKIAEITRREIYALQDKITEKRKINEPWDATIGYTLEKLDVLKAICGVNPDRFEPCKHSINQKGVCTNKDTTCPASHQYVNLAFDEDSEESKVFLLPCGVCNRENVDGKLKCPFFGIDLFNKRAVCISSRKSDQKVYKDVSVIYVCADFIEAAKVAFGNISAEIKKIEEKKKRKEAAKKTAALAKSIKHTTESDGRGFADVVKSTIKKEDPVEIYDPSIVSIKSWGDSPPPTSKPGQDDKPRKVGKSKSMPPSEKEVQIVQKQVSTTPEFNFDERSKSEPMFIPTQLGMESEQQDRIEVSAEYVGHALHRGIPLYMNVDDFRKISKEINTTQLQKQKEERDNLHSLVETVLLNLKKAEITK